MKFTSLTPALAQYIERHHSHSDDPVLSELKERTLTLGGVSNMQISSEQGTLLTILTAVCSARLAVEVGTFTGYSSICLARGLQPGGRLHCFDRSDEWTGIAREFWQRAGVAERIELHLGDGHEQVKGFRPDAPVDIAFIDADKSGYDIYYEALLPLMRPNGLILFDNMLRDGKVASPEQFNDDDRAIDALNGKLAGDNRVESVLIPVADGLTLCRVLS